MTKVVEKLCEGAWLEVGLEVALGVAVWFMTGSVGALRERWVR